MGLDTEIEVIDYSKSLDIRACVQKANDRLEEEPWFPGEDKAYGEPYYNRFVANSQVNGADFPTLWRYYGQSYTRGPWLWIYAVIRVAWWAFPGASVFYRNDCESRDQAELMTEASTAAYWERWGSEFGRDYYR